MKKYLVLMIAVIGTSIGSALGIKAAVGVTAWDALATTIGNLGNIKIGTVGMLLNTICFLLQVILLKRKFKKVQYFQLIVTTLIGVVVNYTLYDVLVFDLPSYGLRIGMIILSFIIMAFFTGIVMSINLITFPLEGLVMAIATKFKINFAKLRQAADVIFLVICIVLPLIFSSDFAIREGTVIGMLSFGPLLGWFMKIQKPFLSHQNLI